jgi:hypothetical protein
MNTFSDQLSDYASPEEVEALKAELATAWHA